MCQGHDDFYFQDSTDLIRLPYFEYNDEGKINLKSSVAEHVIDCHTHLGWNFALGKTINLYNINPIQYYFPEKGVSLDLKQYSAQDYTPEAEHYAHKELTKSLYNTQNGIVSSHTVPNLIHEMNLMSVSHSIVLAIDLLVASNNSEHLLEHNKEQKRLVTFASVHPLKNNLRKRVQSFKDKGAKGLKIHPQIQTIRASHPAVIKLTQIAGELDMPVLFHSGASDISPDWQSDFADLRHFHSVLRECPDTTVILAHGGIHQHREVIRLMKKYNNAYVELSGQAPGPIREMIDELGSDRILFGSDWPFYPIRFPLAKVLIATEGDPQSRENILWKNAQNLFNIEL